MQVRWLITVLLGALLTGGLLGSAAIGASIKPTLEELYGKKGDPGTFDVNGRLISVKVAAAVAEGNWSKYLIFWDITNPIDIWGDVKKLPSSGGQLQIRGLTGEGGRYEYSLLPERNDFTLKFGAIGDRAPVTTSLREVSLFYLRQAVTKDWTLQVGSVTYFITPQTCRGAVIVKGPGKCGKAWLFYRPAAKAILDDPTSDFVNLLPQYILDLGPERIPIGSSGYELRLDPNTEEYNVVKTE